MLIGYTRTNMNGETDPRDFEQFMLRPKRAARPYVSGDFRPLGEIAACELPATFPVPGGEYVVGTDRVANQYASDTAAFKAAAEACSRSSMPRPMSVLPIG